MKVDITHHCRMVVLTVAAVVAEQAGGVVLVAGVDQAVAQVSVVVLAIACVVGIVDDSRGCAAEPPDGE